MGRPVLSCGFHLLFWQGVRAGLSIAAASIAAGVSPSTGDRWFRDAGGIIGNTLVLLGSRYLSLAERETISRSLAAGVSVRAIAGRLGRAPSTVSREISRNGGARQYRAVAAQRAASVRARRPKTAKLTGNQQLRVIVETRLGQLWSPRQISLALARQFPGRPEMRVSHETIYQSLYVQSRGALRKELTGCLRTGRALRKPRRQPVTGVSTLPGMVMISDRPAHATDRAVPGHWEGDLIIGKNNRSAIGTLVERSTRFVMLLHLPNGYDAITVRDAMITTVETLPAALKQSLTWDQGREMARHHEITIATGLPIYFCDPHSPWQRGSNENTNGLLRQYFPKGTDLRVHSAQHLTAVAAQLNGRPRHTLGWITPAQSLARVLSGLPPVATTT